MGFLHSFPFVVLALRGAAAQAWNPSGANSCIGLPHCGTSEGNKLCNAAINKYIDNGYYDSVTSFYARENGVLCNAAFQCDSSGSWETISGADLKKAFASVQNSCKGCGQHSLSKPNCWISLIAADDDPRAQDTGGPFSISKTQAPPKSTTKTSTTTKKTTTTSQKTTTTSKKTTTTTTTAKKTTTVPKTTTTTKKTTAPPKTTTKASAPGSSPSSTPDQLEDKSNQDVKSASAATNNLKQNPTDNSLAKLAKKAIDDALDSTKKAVDGAKDAVVKSALAELVDALAEAATAAAAAAAASTAATAAALAAAMDSVNQSNEKVQEKRNPKSTKLPSTTAKPTKSTSTKSKSSSTTTSSTSTCPYCFPCQESSLPVDTVEEKRSHARDLAPRGERDVTICGKSSPAPNYVSWSSKNSNKYSPFYAHQFKQPSGRCGDYTWSLLQAPKTEPIPHTSKLTYAAEHVYELQFADIFIKWLGANNPVVKAEIAKSAGKKDACSLVFTSLVQPGKAWQGSWNPWTDLVSQFSGGSRTSELTYLDNTLNGLKKNWAANLSLNPKDTPIKELIHLGQLSSMYMYLKDPHVVEVFQAVSARMRNFWSRLDDRIEAVIPQGSVKWAKGINLTESYVDWEAEYFSALDAKYASYVDKSARLMITRLNASPQNPAVKRLIQNVQTQLTPAIGLLSKNAFSVAGDLF